MQIPSWPTFLSVSRLPYTGNGSKHFRFKRQICQTWNRVAIFGSVKSCPNISCTVECLWHRVTRCKHIVILFMAGRCKLENTLVSKLYFAIIFNILMATVRDKMNIIQLYSDKFQNKVSKLLGTSFGNFSKISVHW
jgi:hypothetical protein